MVHSTTTPLFSQAASIPVALATPVSQHYNEDHDENLSPVNHAKAPPSAAVLGTVRMAPATRIVTTTRLILQRREKDVGHETLWDIYHRGKQIVRLANGTHYELQGVQAGDEIMIKLRGKAFWVSVKGMPNSSNSNKSKQTASSNVLFLRLKHKVSFQAGLGGMTGVVTIAPSDTRNEHLKRGLLEFRSF